MQVRNHVVAIAQVTFMARVMTPGEPGSGEMEVKGKEPMTKQVVAIVPGSIMSLRDGDVHTDEATSAGYLASFLNEQFGHWGQIDGKRYRLDSVKYLPLDGIIEKKTY